MTDAPLQGKIALVTGSTSGIGLAIATRLSQNGCHVILHGLSDKATTATLQKTLKADYYDADLSNVSAIHAMMQAILEKHRRLDIIVNNAGIQYPSPIETFPDDQWDRIIAINLSAAFHIIKASIPAMRQQQWGRIVNIASAHGLVASPNKSAYVAAKHAIIGLTKTVALETAEDNISCNAICPGWVLTPLVEAQIEKRAKDNRTSFEQEKIALVSEKQPNKHFAMPEEIAALTSFLCQTPSNAITGATLPIDGGWTAW